MIEHDMISLNDFATMPRVERLAMFCHESGGIVGAYYHDHHAPIMKNRKALTAADMGWPEEAPSGQTLLEYTLEKLHIAYSGWYNMLGRQGERKNFPNIHRLEEDSWGKMIAIPDTSMGKNLQDVYTASTSLLECSAQLLEMNLKAIDQLQDPDHKKKAEEGIMRTFGHNFIYWRISDVSVDVSLWTGKPLNKDYTPEKEPITACLLKTPLLVGQLMNLQLHRI